MFNIKELADMDKNRGQDCQLEILNVETGRREVIKKFCYVIEAPNWTKDGTSLIYNSRGLMYNFNIETGNVTEIDTDFATNCNNDHVLSPDGKSLAISNFKAEDLTSLIYYLPINGGTPKLVTSHGPSYLHGWSPDGNDLCFCGFRKNQYNLYSIPVRNGDEIELTNGGSHDDGPEYSPCGNYIWFNSTRSGLMQIWRMDKNGDNPLQMTFEEDNSWFPHCSPDGEKVVYISYLSGEVKPNEHLPDKSVELRIMNSDGCQKRTLASFRGGQGTINVNSWSPDSTKIAFVSY